MKIEIYFSHMSFVEKIKNIDIKKEIFFWIGLIISIFLMVSFYTYNPKDPSFFTFSNQEVSNYCGPIGAFISDLFFQTIGLITYIFPILIGFYLFVVVRKGFYKHIDIINFIFFILSLSILLYIISPKSFLIKSENIKTAGVLGEILGNFLKKFLNYYGALLISFLLTSIFFILTFKISILKVITNLFLGLTFYANKLFLLCKTILLNLTSNKKNKIKITPKPKKEKKEEPIILKEEINNNKNKEGIALPDISLLQKPLEKENDIDENYLNQKKEVLLEKFKDFGITGEVVNILTGPVVTLFEFKPDPGIKLSKIKNLEQDLTMALKALSVRIVAPIPGKEAVGIEVPNDKRKIVYFREIIESSLYKNSKSFLTLALGKTIDGKPYISDLAKMPHLLVAGSTGSGKSVCINTMLISILYRATPEDVRFILVDPKMLELSVYNGIPHLLLPVITEPEKAATALKWAIGEMEKRYEKLAENEVRDVLAYNKKVSKEEKLPFIVIIIDELADLMMIAPKDVETSIARLTQKARAAGIHLILATQRPSVDVITGLIKNNLPSRIAFKVTSRADSRTILDSMGAESLLGHGDMLFIPPGHSNPIRLQGALITNEEILNVTNFLKKTRKPEYLEDEIINYEDEKKDIYNGNFSDNEYDPLYDEAVKFVSTLETISISMLQRKFKIGYNRSAKIIETMEREGIVSKADGSKPRKVLIKEL